MFPFDDVIMFTHVAQGYFTGIDAIPDCPSGSEAILTNVGKNASYKTSHNIGVLF